MRKERNQKSFYLLVCSFEVAKYISEDSYGLVFGVNTFFALLTQSLLTLVVINTLMLNIRQQVRRYVENASRLDIRFPQIMSSCISVFCLRQLLPSFSRGVHCDGYY